MTTAIILAGGLGTRLAQTVPYLPKALAPIRGTPFLDLLLRQLAKANIVSKVVLALGHKAADIQAFISHTSYPFSLESSIESTPLGTGGAILHALPKVSTETLLILNGDSYFDLSLVDFLHFHRTKKADISIACREVENTSRYGSLHIDPSSQKILSFQEKSSDPKPGWINAGLYCIEKKLFLPLPAGPCSLETNLFPLFLSKKLFAYPHTGSFIDIGTKDSYHDAQEILKPWIPA